MGATWHDLAGAALARQFPADTDASVAEAVGAVGPMQTQTARSAFLGLAARFPGTSHAALTGAYDRGDVVRGSTIRGTVHTATPRHFTVLGLATRLGQRSRWTQVLKMPDALVDALWAATEDHAREWRTPEELRDHLVSWLEEHDCAGPAGLAAGDPGRYLAFGHGGLVRRPASGTRWEGQGRPLYRTLDPAGPASLSDVVRLHLTRHGPASRQDVAWWSGLTLGAVDEGLAGLDLVEHQGPDGRTYLDVPGSPAPRDLPGVRLLPEFDALLCGYDPRARARFVTPEHHRRLWRAANGLLLPPLLVDGRISGHWRLSGTARSRSLEVTWFSRTRRPRKSELEEPAAALEAALDITVTAVTVSRELA